MALGPGGLPAVRDLEPGARCLISSIQPVGTGTEVRLVDGQPLMVGMIASHQGALTSGGVPWELVRRFLGQRFTRHEGFRTRRRREAQEGPDSASSHGSQTHRLYSK